MQKEKWHLPSEWGEKKVSEGKKAQGQMDEK